MTSITMNVSFCNLYTFATTLALPYTIVSTAWFTTR
jgi:hypothetical protein